MILNPKPRKILLLYSLLSRLSMYFLLEALLLSGSSPYLRPSNLLES
jgi:hypothetical protein